MTKSPKAAVVVIVGEAVEAAVDTVKTDPACVEKKDPDKKDPDHSHSA